MIFFYSSTIHQPVNESFRKGFNNFLPFNVKQHFLREFIPLDELDKTLEETITHEDFESSHIKCESYENINELKNARDYDSDIHNVIFLDDLNKQQLSDERVQMVFERVFRRSRHNTLSLFVITHGFYVQHKDTIRENCTIIHQFIRNFFANIDCIDRQLSLTDMLIKKYKRFVNIVWSEDYNFVTIDLTKKLMGKIKKTTYALSTFFSTNYVKVKQLIKKWTSKSAQIVKLKNPSVSSIKTKIQKSSYFIFVLESTLFINFGEKKQQMIFGKDLLTIYRDRLRNALFRKVTKENSKTKELLGVFFEEFKNYIEF